MYIQVQYMRKFLSLLVVHCPHSGFVQHTEHSLSGQGAKDYQVISRCITRALTASVQNPQQLERTYIRCSDYRVLGIHMPTARPPSGVQEDPADWPRTSEM